ncbi:MAG: bacteriocin-protection protein, YdeI/OmpD-associated family [Micrococcales bacterium 70-64]|nr:YdeI/OmpD-associated family protein [Leifsonia sp.]ODU64199.1 MAG: bacteriocin-protection protein, YdeI/OmpD-associated family [Leifsonia sp. SCN 70-46]OJX85889.1 MAG: bacteriocin-protection protein, YdeI/OmpD-associated family [Micrococcales bacterium 70-64]
MAAVSDKPILELDDILEWERYLEGSPSPVGVRLRVRKTGSAKPGILVADSLQVALCFGWIDGQRNGLDDDYFLQAYSPRRARSTWSQVNREYVEKLIAEGRMREGGQLEVDRAKADGRWDAAYRQKGNPVPDDLRAALDANPAAAAFFETLNSQNRFAVLFRIGNVKRAETRARKIAGFVDDLSRGVTIYPQRDKA